MRYLTVTGVQTCAPSDLQYRDLFRLLCFAAALSGFGDGRLSAATAGGVAAEPGICGHRLGAHLAGSLKIGRASVGKEWRSRWSGESEQEKDEWRCVEKVM